ncbi:hypothetical protein CISECK363B_20575 [Citrobacter sedlakii]
MLEMILVSMNYTKQSPQSLQLRQSLTTHREFSKCCRNKIRLTKTIHYHYL